MNKTRNFCRLHIDPEDRDIRVLTGSILADVLQESGIQIVLPCGGNGSCGKCTVKFLSGAPEPVYEESLFLTKRQLQNGTRLACLCAIDRDAHISVSDILESAGEQILTSGRSHRLKPDPAVKKRVIAVSGSSIEELKSDEEIILRDAGHAPVNDPEILRMLPATVHRGTGEATVTYYDRIVLEVEKGDTGERLYGIALDLGTTTMVLSLHDLIHGETLYLHAGPNPQRRHGDDLISRLTYAGAGKDHLRQLHTETIDFMNRVIRSGCRECKIDPHDVRMLTVSGNTVMNHLFLGVDPSQIGQAPYTPVFKTARTIRAEQLQLDLHPRAPVYIAPNIGGFVGGDIISDMLVAGFGRRRKGIRLLVDIGTNCEVVLETGGRLYAASSPAGPALEGACITGGMRAAPGAILDAFVDQEKLRFQTIHDVPPKGICGSGLFHLVDVFFRLGIIEPGGRVKPVGEVSDRSARSMADRRIILDRNNQRSLMLDEHLMLSQGDIREFQLAKAAIAAAWKYLCVEARCAPEDISSVYIAGAFGNYIRPLAAINLGLIPDIDPDHVHFVGNASLEGARMMLLNKKYQRMAQKLSEMTRFIELAGKPGFQEMYVENMRLGKSV